MEDRPDTKVLELRPRRDAPPMPGLEPPDTRSGAPDMDAEPEADKSFRRVLEQAMQLRELRGRARDVYRTCPVRSFTGLSALLEMLLPQVDVLEGRVADAVRLPLADLRQLAVGAISPISQR